MKTIRILCGILCVLIPLCCCGCDFTASPDDSSSETGTESETGTDVRKTAWQATETSGVYRYVAEDGSTDFPECEVKGGVLLTKQTEAGMDSFRATLTARDLYDGKTLGTLEIPDGMWLIRQTNDGFAVLNQTTGEYTRYGADCKKMDSVTIETKDAVNYLLPSDDGAQFVYADPATGRPVLFDISSGKQTVCSEKAVGALLGTSGDAFYYEDSEKTLRKIGKDGTETVLQEQNEAISVFPYLLCTTKKGFGFRKIDDEAFSFFKADGVTEYPLAATDGFLLCEGKNGCRLYDLKNGKAAEIPTKGDCTSYSGFANEGEIYISVSENDWSELYVIQTAELTFSETISIRPAEKGDLEDPLVSAWNGSEQAKAEAARILETYGVIVGYESEEFTDEVMWYQFTPATAARADEYLFYVSEYLKMLPDGIMREIHPGKEPVIFLCDELKGDMQDFGDIAGFAIEFARHPFVAIETCNPKDSFIENLSHEIFHLFFEQNEGIREALSEWDEMSPEGSYLMGYDVSDPKYTPYDATEFEDTWFLTSYARTFPAEDRAVTGEYLFLSATEGKLSGYFKNYPHLKEKAKMFCKLLHEHYEACRNETPYWEKILGYTYKGE